MIRIPTCPTKQGAIAGIAHVLPNTITVAMQSGSKEQVMCHMREQGISFPAINDQDGRPSME